jgi:hypothetical protein
MLPIESSREKLGALLTGPEVRVLPQEKIKAKLDSRGELFLLLVKTNMRIPYTSVFFDWTADI